MKNPSYEGLFIALIPQRGPALVELLRDACRVFLGDRDLRPWGIEFGQVPAPAGAVVFRLASLSEPFPWRDGTFAQLAQAVSRLGGGRCWAVGLEKAGRGAEPEGWSEGVAYDCGERTAFEEGAGAEGRAELLAWLGEQLVLSENELGALFESCVQHAGVLDGEEPGQDELELILERARTEFQRYRQLKQERESHHS